ncbi:glutamyl-tRNA(Gln) amidotransferase subunit A, mitochondrial-like [Physella acuta]|uniref:glutamyl-tRNA(Gln) amidotransferase subunit A, mitochondrial-like n=1 Tax=Physella acuta TaxID=109671 RepID=UPI0027DE219E|nr:glutamyl-tRNA(Gln) amidotransferase subunit A, mitochondrial-like [Physella acuta]
MKSLTVKEALLQMRKGILTAQELCVSCQEKIKKTKSLNMYVTETRSEEVHKQAELSHLAYKKGVPKSLEGIPIAFKDNFCTNGYPTTCSSKMLLNYKPPFDATMVSKINQAGGIVLGKTNMDEFAMGSGSLDSCHGPVINPWNYVVSPSSSPTTASSSQDSLPSSSVTNPSDWFIAGGSSGGSAAAVASGTCLAAFGSDTGGSTRNPASYCGVVGLKPTYGLLSRHGLIPLVNSMDVPGILTKTVEDSALILNNVAGHDVRDSTTLTDSYTPFNIQENLDLSKLHIGIPKEFHAPFLSEDVLSLWKKIADQFEQAGAKVTQVSMPNTPMCIICYHVLCCCEVASNFSRYDGIEFGLRDGTEESTEELYAQSRHKGFNDVVRGRILAGNYFLLKKNYNDYFIKAQKVRRLISNDFQNVFSTGVNLLLTPTTLTDAPLYSWFSKQDNRTRCEEQDIFTTPANMAGVPAITLPLGLSRQGLPLSLQLMGPHLSESTLLSAAYWLEQQAQFSHLDIDLLDQLNNKHSSHI